MNIEKKLEEIIFQGIMDAEYVLPKEAKYCAEAAVQAILTSPDIVIMDREKFEKRSPSPASEIEKLQARLEAAEAVCEEANKLSTVATYVGSYELYVVNADEMKSLLGALAKWREVRGEK